MSAKNATKSKVNEAGVYTKPTLRKQIFERIKAGSKVVPLGSGLPGKHKWLPNNTKKQAAGTNLDQRIDICG
jgi:hypothetical protein